MAALIRLVPSQGSAGCRLCSALRRWPPYSRLGDGTGSNQTWDRTCGTTNRRPRSPRCRRARPEVPRNPGCSVNRLCARAARATNLAAKRRARQGDSADPALGAGVVVTVPHRVLARGGPRYISAGRYRNLHLDAPQRCNQTVLGMPFCPGSIERRRGKALEDSPVVMLHGGGTQTTAMRLASPAADCDGMLGWLRLTTRLFTVISCVHARITSSPTTDGSAEHEIDRRTARRFRRHRALPLGRSGHRWPLRVSAVQ